MLHIQIAMWFINSQNFVAILISPRMFNRVIGVLSKALHFQKSGSAVRDGSNNKGTIWGDWFARHHALHHVESVTSP